MKFGTNRLIWVKKDLKMGLLPHTLELVSHWTIIIFLGITYFGNLGIAILCGSWMYSLRSINNIILGRGGKNVIFTTYSPFFKLRSLNIPLENVIIRNILISDYNSEIPNVLLLLYFLLLNT